MNTKNNQIQTLNDQIVRFQTKLANGTLPASKLIGVGMQYIDNRTDIGSHFLEVTGHICERWNKHPKNCVLHVSTTRIDNSTGIE
jgi:hypothetical protein